MIQMIKQWTIPAIAVGCLWRRRKNTSALERKCTARHHDRVLGQIDLGIRDPETLTLLDALPVHVIACDVCHRLAFSHIDDGDGGVWGVTPSD